MSSQNSGISPSPYLSPLMPAIVAVGLSDYPLPPGGAEKRGIMKRTATLSARIHLHLCDDPDKE